MKKYDASHKSINMTTINFFHWLSAHSEVYFVTQSDSDRALDILVYHNNVQLLALHNQ